MDKFYKWIMIIGLVIAVIITLTSFIPKVERESIDLYKIKVSHYSIVVSKRLYFEGKPSVEIIDRTFEDMTFDKDEYVIDTITISSDKGEIFYYEIKDYVTKRDPNNKFTYSVKQVTRRRRIK